MEVKEVFSRLKKEAECSICFHTVNKPKSLPCLHSFCFKCINNFVANTPKEGKTTFHCPVCSTTIVIPAGDKFDDFPTSFYLNRLLDILALEDGSAKQQKCNNCDENTAATSFCFQCNNFLCSACLAAHNRLKVTRAHRQASLENLLAGDVEELVQRPVLCEKLHHEQEPLVYYCQDCRICICLKCSATEHNRHRKMKIRDSAEQHKAETIQAIDKMKNQVSENERKMNKDEEKFQAFEKQVKSSRDEVQAMLSELFRGLKDYETNVMKQLDDLFTTQRQVHLTKQTNFRLGLAQMKSYTNHMEAIVARNIASEIFRSRTIIAQRCEEVLKGNKAKASEIVNVDFVTNEDFYQILRQSGAGRVVTSFTDPSSSAAEGMGLREAECGKRAEFMIITKDAEGQMCYSENDQVTVHIEAARGGDVKAELKNNKDGTIHVTYTPLKHGLHHMMIKINGHLLTGCFWSVHVIPHQYQVVSSFGSEGTGKGKFREPFGVAVSSTGNVAVTDCGNESVQVFSSEGKYLNEFGQGVLNFQPFGIALSIAYINPDHVVVTNDSEAFLFKENGELIQRFSPVHLQSPHGISVTRDGRVLVCEFDSMKVLVLSPDGNKLLQSFMAPDCHTAPEHAVHHGDNFFVSYTCSHCIKVFDMAGNCTLAIGSQGSGEGQFDCPLGVAIDKFNNLIVADEGNFRLQIFTLEGEFVSSIGGEGTELSQVGEPQYVAVSRDGRLYVTDYKHRVYILR